MLLIFKNELLNIMKSLLVVSVANTISQMIALKQLA